MNKIIHNGKTIIQCEDYLEVDGEKTMIPDHVKKSHVRINSIVDGVITINGYVFDPIEKTFKRKNIFKRIIDFFLFF